MPDSETSPSLDGVPAVPPPSERLARKGGTRLTLDCAETVDMPALRAGRLERLRAQLRDRDLAGILLCDPINIRYATGSRNMTVWALHNAARYCYVPTEGPIVLFDFHNCEHLSAGLETIAEVRPAVSWYYFAAGPRVGELAARWAAEIVELVAQSGGGNRRLAVDKCEPAGSALLAAAGLELHDGQECCEQARAIKSPAEVALMLQAVTVCETGMAEMRAALKPGISENELWSLLHAVNIRCGGEWIETRLLSSGGRTNPWFQECSDRPIRAGDLVSFDSDLVGPHGYCADVSRTFFCGPGRPSGEQKRLYGLAYEQVHANLDLLRPGMGFREFAEKAWRMPESCLPNRYSVVVHGVGLCDEYPGVVFEEEYRRGFGYDGVFQPGMTLCVESYMGEVGGNEGVKLEQQVLLTETGLELLSTFPFEEQLLPSRWL